MGKENIYCKQLNGYQDLDLELEIRKMKRIRDRLKKMPDNKEKFLMYRNYMLYYFFLSDLCEEGKFPFEPFDFEWQTVDSKYLMYNYASAEQLKNGLDIINELFKKAREIIQQYGMYKQYDIKKKIDPKMGIELLNVFFGGMSANIRRVYQGVIKGNVSFVDEVGCNCAYDIRYCDSPKIKCNKQLNNYDGYWMMVHEIGHCYYYEVMNGRKWVTGIDDEVPSIFMEILFNNFVEQYLYNQEYGITSLFNRQSWFASLVAMQNVFLERGNNFWLTDEKIVGEMDTSKLTENDKIILGSLDYDVSEMLNGQMVCDEVQITGFKYAISNLLAIYFADVYNQDKKEGLRLLNDYIMLPPSVTLAEKLEMYEITGESYKKMIKRVHDYGKRKHFL